MIDELDGILDTLSAFQFNQALEVLYGPVDMSIPPIQLLLMFTVGIKRNNLFKFHDFVQGINGRSN